MSEHPSEQLKATLNLIPAVVWYASPSGGLTFVNKRSAEFAGELLQAVMERFRHPCGNLVIQSNALQNFGELLLEDFFPCIGFRAFPLISGTVIVDVSAFFDFTNQRTAAVTTGDEAGKCEVVLQFVSPVGSPTVKPRLYTFPKTVPPENSEQPKGRSYSSRRTARVDELADPA